VLLGLEGVSDTMLASVNKKSTAPIKVASWTVKRSRRIIAPSGEARTGAFGTLSVVL
jgi:hypothetical protein